MAPELARIRYDRVIGAVLQNIQTWIDTVAEAEREAPPGHKARLLHLQLNMTQAQRSLERLVEDGTPKP